MIVKPERIEMAQLLESLPAACDDDLMPVIRQAIKQSNQKVVVLDDDPTGTQTVHNVRVLTEWSQESLMRELNNPSPAMFILTNSRSMSLNMATTINKAIATNLQEASRRTGRAFVIVSRSDSTLRGHFPGETDALAEVLGEFDSVLIVPAFMAGGRYTIHDGHYVQEGQMLIPAAETPFAHDATFGYASSNLKAWVREKTAGQVEVESVASISLTDIRDGGVARVATILSALSDNPYCVVNAINEQDLAVFTAGLLQAEAGGKRFLYRSAASFAAIRAGIALRPILTKHDLTLQKDGGGLIVVGSYVPKSSAQLQQLLQNGGVISIEVQVKKLLSNTTQSIEVERVRLFVDQHLAAGEPVVLYTSRELIMGEDAGSSLAIGNRVSASLVQIVKNLQTRPRYIIAKGGITSSDLATKALQVKKATVLGQILPGIPIWQLGDDCTQPGQIYVVFPGNVGDESALARVVEILR